MTADTDVQKSILTTGCVEDHRRLENSATKVGKCKNRNIFAILCLIPFILFFGWSLCLHIIFGFLHFYVYYTHILESSTKFISVYLHPLVGVYIGSYSLVSCSTWYTPHTRWHRVNSVHEYRVQKYTETETFMQYTVHKAQSTFLWLIAYACVEILYLSLKVVSVLRTVLTLGNRMAFQSLGYRE
jgi:hypothetical protein